MYTHDELIDMVSAANIAGHMEHAGRIVVCDDEELLNTITQELENYKSAIDTAMGEMASNEELFNWYDWIEDALIREYGTDKGLESMWSGLTDVPFDEGETDMLLAEDWFGFPKGTAREDIWHWFDEHHSKGAGYLLNDWYEEQERPNILIGVSGGIVQGVSCNLPDATCKIYDADTEEYTKETDEEFTRLANTPGYKWIY